MRRVLLLAGVLLLAPRISADDRGGHRPLRNAIVVSIDSVRADHLGFHGYPRATTPRLEELAERRGALVFERATAVSPSCHPSHSTLMLGLYPPQSGVPWCAENVLADEDEADDDATNGDFVDEDFVHGDASNGDDEPRPLPMARKRVSTIANWLRIPDANPTLAGFLRQQGLRTGAFVSIWTIERRFGYDRGFEVFADDMPEYYGPPRLSWILRHGMRSQRRQVGEVTIDRALAYLDGLGDGERFFLFVHLADSHVPYDSRAMGPFEEDETARRRLEALWRSRYPEETRKRAMGTMWSKDGFLLDLYDASIRYADAQLGRLLDALEDRGRLDDTLVVVTSDHGDSMGQHRYLSAKLNHRLFFEHSLYVWEETQHVPMIVLDPAVHRLERRTANVSHVDVVPTVITRLGFDVADFGELPGRDLTRLPEAPRTVYFLTFGRGRPWLLKRSFNEYPKFIGFRSGDLKFFVDRDRFKNPDKGRCFLFDLARDPNELDNLCATAREETVAAYRRTLVAWYDRAVAGRKE